MKLTVLGKYGPYGKPGVGAASGYLLSDGKFKLLCDMGSGVMSRLLAVTDVSELSGIFVSHLHYDHTSDLLPFRYLLDEIEKPVNIYTHRETNNPYYDLLFDSPYFNVVDIDENTVVNLDGAELKFFKMNHGMTCYAVRAESPRGAILYTGDTMFTDKIIEAGQGCDIILADCAKPEHFIGGHMQARYAFEIRDKTDALVIATHLAPSFSPEALFGDARGILIAEEGKTYTVSRPSEN